MYMYLQWWYSTTNTRNKIEALTRELCAYSISYYITYEQTHSREINLQYIYTVECRYNPVQYNKIFHTALRWLKHDINQSVK